MTKRKYILVALVFFIIGMGLFAQEQRFPRPEFHTEYQLPEVSTPTPRALFMEYVDVALLLLVMSLTVYFVFKKRSRNAILWLSVFSLAYFGFYRVGCICSVGSMQNITLALFDNTYTVSFSVLAFFFLPLIFALAVGRIFCAAACPLGAIQDLVLVKSVRISPWVQKTLGLFPFVYLGLAVLFAATESAFIICKYDPFIGIFRLGAPFYMILAGIGFLLTGMFVARPYCRFVCPYGALLKVCSLHSKHHLSITPDECINCKLCKDSCPFHAIEYPVEEKAIRKTAGSYRTFFIYATLIPVFVIGGGWAVSGTYKILSNVHPDVHLATKIVSLSEQELQASKDVYVEAFLAAGRTKTELVTNALRVQDKFKTGGWYLGAFIGLVIGLVLLNELIFRKRSIYEPNKGNCLSCGRCMVYCPVGKPEHPYFTENVLDNEQNTI
jgi:polyferredoxin